MTIDLRYTYSFNMVTPPLEVVLCFYSNVVFCLKIPGTKSAQTNSNVLSFTSTPSITVWQESIDLHRDVTGPLIGLYFRSIKITKIQFTFRLRTNRVNRSTHFHSSSLYQTCLCLIDTYFLFTLQDPHLQPPTKSLRPGPWSSQSVWTLDKSFCLRVQSVV